MEIADSYLTTDAEAVKGFVDAMADDEKYVARYEERYDPPALPGHQPPAPTESRGREPFQLRAHEVR